MSRWLLSLLMLVCSIGAASAQSLVINEVVYDSPGTDVDTWLELKGTPGMSLDGYEVVGCNGNGGVEYQAISLAGFVMPADGYFVIAESAAVPNGDTLNSNVDYQNGPDSIKLKFNGVVIDALGYDVHGGTDIFCGEGSPTPDQVPPNSLARCPDGWDSNNNVADFVLDATPTPGTPNDGSCGPVLGACCFINGTCSNLTQDDCAAQGGTYQGNGTDCDPNPCVAQPTDRTLCEISADLANGRPALEGEFVRVEGLVLNNWNNWAGNRIEFTITDGNCCTNVFWNSVTTPEVYVGDYVRVIGTVGFFNGKTQITTPSMSIEILSTGNPLPDPTLVATGDFALNGEAYESCLVKFQCVTITDPATWPPVGADANVPVDDGSGVATLRIDRDTDIDGTPVPTGPFTVIGIGNQFDSSDPWDSGFQLNARSIADFDFEACLPHAGACCFVDGTCSSLLEADCVAQGGTFQGEDTLCDPNPCPQPEGACCFPDCSCLILTADACAAAGGVYSGNFTLCDPNPCPCPTGACCFADCVCVVLTGAQCAAEGGVYMGDGVSCDPNPCDCPPPMGACCFDDGSCQVTSQEDCGGLWLEGQTCDPNPCPPTPVERTTWGQIKANYR